MGRDTVTATATRLMQASPEQIFDAWLEPDLVNRWMRRSLELSGLEGKVRRVEIDPRVDGGFVFSDERDGEEAVHWGSYRRLERPRALQFSWFTSEEEEKEDLSLVTLLLEPEGNGTSATISHEISAEWAEFVEQAANAWENMLRAMDEELKTA